jgi:hypothetical protein
LDVGYRQDAEVTVRTFSKLLVAAVVATSLACADRREPIAREQLAGQIASQSNGALTLEAMKKTNGFDHEREGMKLHTIEWEATLKAQANGWKAGWRDYQVLSAEPNALAAAVEGLSVKTLVKGSIVTLQGKSELQKADRGWRVLQSEVTASKVTPPPYAISTFSNLPPFIQGCHTALALSEAGFRRGQYVYADDTDQQAFMILGDVPTTLRFVRYVENPQPAFTEYTSGAYTVRISIQSTSAGEDESHIVHGELTVTHGTNTTTERVFGERAC